jgi:hypothetical protein
VQGTLSRNEGGRQQSERSPAHGQFAVAKKSRSLSRKRLAASATLWGKEPPVGGHDQHASSRAASNRGKNRPSGPRNCSSAFIYLLMQSAQFASMTGCRMRVPVHTYVCQVRLGFRYLAQAVRN